MANLNRDQQTLLQEIVTMYRAPQDRSLPSLRKVRKAINKRLRPETGNTVLRLAEQLIHVKALSWALRELTTHYPKELRKYLKDNSENLPARVTREVANKLETGLKNPKKIHHGR